jgi:hypothetical protein
VDGLTGFAIEHVEIPDFVVNASAGTRNRRADIEAKAAPADPRPTDRDGWSGSATYGASHHVDTTSELP